MKKKITAIFLVVVMLVTTCVTGNFTKKKNVLAAEAPKSIKMPITVYDHLSDNLLFEYDFGNPYSNELSMEGFTELLGESAGKGLVEETLGKNGTPVYKREVVEKVAQLVQSYMEDTYYKKGTELYEQLYNQITKKGEEETILDASVYRQELMQMGWDFGNTTYVKENGVDKWKDNAEEVIWYRDNDWLRTNGGADNVATFDFGMLEAGTYSLTFYQKSNVKLVVTCGNNKTEINKSGDKFTVDGKSDVTLSVAALNDNEGSFTNPNLEKDGVRILTNFTKPQSKTLSAMGWIYDKESSWTNSQWGGITCDSNEKSSISIEREVISDAAYNLKYYNENDLLNVTVYDNKGNKLSEGKNDFTVPAGVNKIKIELSNKGNSDKVIRFDELILRKKSIAKLGRYDESKSKFENGAGLKDITTCMDYAYYRLNSFWSDTRGEVTQKTDLYSTLQLDLVDNLFKFSNDYKINYDIDNKNICQDVNVTANQELGFYPLDKNVLKDKTDLREPYGTEMYNEYDGMNHNYHFSMKAKCEFLYKEADNLQFNFNGDDDVYLYIDGKLVLDIGGAHLKRGENLDVNDIAKKVGLVEGEVYSFDFFYMERHTTASNITIETNMILEQADAKPFVTYKDKEGNKLESDSKVDIGEEVSIEYGITAGNDKMSNVTFKDESLGVTIGKDGIDLGDQGVTVPGKITVTVTDKDGNIKETYTIDKDDLTDEEKVSKFSEKIGSIRLDKDDTITVTGLTKKVDYDTVIESELNVDITADLKQYTDKGTIEDIPTVISVAPVATATIPQNTPKADLEVSLNDNAGNRLPEQISEGTEVYVDYVLTAQSNNMKSVGIEDEKIGFKIDKEGIVIPEDYNIEHGLTVKLTDGKGTVKDTITIQKSDIENNTDVYKELLSKLDNQNDSWELNKGYTIEVTGLNKEIDSNPIEAKAEAKLTGPVPTYDSESKKVSVTWEKATADDQAKVSPKPAYNVIFNIEDEAMGSLNGETSYRVDGGTTTGNEPTVNVNAGYKFVKWTQTVGNQTTDVTGEPKDVIINADTVFTAVLEPVEKGYIVKYVDEDNNSIKEDKVVEDVKYGSTHTETAAVITGYTLNDEKTKGITVSVNDEENVVIFKYKTNKYPYDVRYVDENNQDIADKKEASVNYGTDVIEEALEIEGYTLKDDASKTITIDTENNQIVFHYVTNEYPYTVRYVDDDNNDISDMMTKSAKYSDKVTEKAINIKGYTLNDEDTKRITIKVDGNEIVFKYTINKYPYTVKYVDKNGNELIDSKNAEAVFGASVNEKAEFIKGYTCISESEQNIVIDTENNEIVFVYEPNAYDYKVKYVDTKGNQLSDDKNGSALYGAEITEKAINITGYNLINDSEQSIKIDTDNNVITFVYGVEAYDYEVRYVDEKDNDISDKVTKKAEYGTNVTEKYIDIDGYTLRDEEEKTIKIDVDGNQIIFHYVTNSYAYTVKYVDKETREEIAASVTGAANFGEVVSTNAVKIQGYTLDGTEARDITISSKDNTVIYEYVINKYDVKFVADEHGKVEGDTEQTVKYNHTVDSVPTPVPDKGYEFLGWDKTVSTGTSVSENPEKELITENTVFTAKFGPLDYGYVVKYVDEDGNELLTSKQGEKKTFGTDVTENAPEIYGYTVDANEKTLTIDTESNEIVFVYTKKLYDVKFTTDGNGVIEGTTDYQVKYNETVEKTPSEKANEGYHFTGWTMTVGEQEAVVIEDPSTVKITDNTIFTANYVPNTYDYVIKYVDEAGKSLVDDVIKSAVFGTEVTESPIAIEGYTTTDGDKTIKIKVEGNQIIFVYKKNPIKKTMVKDANDQNGKNYGKGKNPKTVVIDDEDREKTSKSDKSGENGTSSSTVSPKTGYSMLIEILWMIMVMTFAFAGVSIKKMRKYGKQK